MSANPIFEVVDRGQVKQAKVCEQCEKVFVNRKKWGAQFEEVRFCSKRCKSQH